MGSGNDRCEHGWMSIQGPCPDCRIEFLEGQAKRLQETNRKPNLAALEPPSGPLPDGDPHSLVYIEAKLASGREPTYVQGTILLKEIARLKGAYERIRDVSVDPVAHDEAVHDLTLQVEQAKGDLETTQRLLATLMGDAANVDNRLADITIWQLERDLAVASRAALTATTEMLLDQWMDDMNQRGYSCDVVDEVRAALDDRGAAKAGRAFAERLQDAERELLARWFTRIRTRREGSWTGQEIADLLRTRITDDGSAGARVRRTNRNPPLEPLRISQAEFRADPKAAVDKAFEHGSVVVEQQSNGEPSIRMVTQTEDLDVGFEEPAIGVGIYTASKTRHAAKWQALRKAGTPVISTWIDEGGKGETLDFGDLWRRCIGEACSCAVLILYVEEGDVLKGAYVEVGAALSAGRRVLVVGEQHLPSTSFQAHARVTCLESLEQALLLAEDIILHEVGEN